MKRLFLVLILICSYGRGLVAQEFNVYSNKEDQKMFESGRTLFDEKLYTLAYERFSVLLEKHPKDNYLRYLIGICGIFISDKHDEAYTLLNEVKTKNPKAADIDYYFALYYHKTYAFDKSMELAGKLLEDPKLDLELKKKLGLLILQCENGKEVISNKIEAKIDNLGGPPNSAGDEYSPVLTADEQTLFFTYRGNLCKGGLRDLYDQPSPYGFYYEDIYMSKKINGAWQEPVGLENVNTESNEAALAISNDGQQLFIYRAREEDGGDIYMSRLNGTEFGKPEKLKGEINTENWEGSIALSGDGKQVIFASDRPGGYGGKDLYRAVKMGDNSWGKVKNLGYLINTAYDEDGPFIHPDGRSLVFSSVGHNSFGDYDIFLSELNEIDSTWKKPMNVGFPINTTDDDIFYTLSTDGKRGYFSSSKAGGFGNKDIYVEEPVVFSKSSYLTVVKGIITEDQHPYSCDINVLVGKEGLNYATYRSNSSNGNFVISLPAGRNYKVVFDHPTDSDRVVDINMDKNISYSEMKLDVNFGQKNASPVKQVLVASPVPNTTVALVSAGNYSNSNTSSANNINPAATTNSANNTATINARPLNSDPVAEIKKPTRSELLAKYGEVVVSGLKYQVQVGAYRKPQNFDAKKLQNVTKVKNAGIINGDVNLLVADKEFMKWKTADEFLAEVKKAGQKDAFIIANYNGKRLYMKDLAEMGIWASALSMACNTVLQECK